MPSASFAFVSLRVPFSFVPFHRQSSAEWAAASESPRAQAGDGDIELADQGLQRLTAQEASDGGQLAPGGVATLRPGTARGGAGVSVVGARRRPLGLVAADLIHGSDLRLQ